MNLSVRSLPTPTPETEEFWEGTRQQELRLQRCTECENVYFPPRPFCPRCACRDVSTFVASGRGTLHSYVINHLAPKGWEVPYSIAVVELEEGPKMMTNIVNCPQTPEALVIDMAVEVVFETLNDEIALPLFARVEGR